MAEILFTHPYFLRFDPKQWKAMQPYPPLATLYAAALVRKAGYAVHLFDPMFSKAAEEIVHSLKGCEVVVIYEDCFNYLTKMCLTNMRHAAFRMSEIANSAGCKVIVCGSDATDHYRLYLEHGADIVILGEGEQTLLEVLSEFTSEASREFKSIKGIAFYEEEKITVTPKRAVNDQLDLLPHPAWDLVNIHEYSRRWRSHHGYFSLNVVTTRGCPYKCNWCAKPVYGNRYNSHSPQWIADEVEHLHKAFKPDHLWFCDDIFGLKPGWIKEFGRLLTERKIKIPFKIQSRADLISKEAVVSALSAAGCETVWLGAESGSQKILDAMDKGLAVEEIYSATGLLKKHGIKPSFFLQFGYPGESLEDIQKTIRMVNDLLPEDIGVSVSYPLPGTKFYENVKAELGKKSNWSDSDDLDIMFRNTFSPGFYKALHRYIHKSYRKTQAISYMKYLLQPDKKGNDFKLKIMLAFPYYMLMAKMEKMRIIQLEPHAEACL